LLGGRNKTGKPLVYEFLQMANVFRRMSTIVHVAHPASALVIAAVICRKPQINADELA
jgi:hypothetical protein